MSLTGKARACMRTSLTGLMLLCMISAVSAQTPSMSHERVSMNQFAVAVSTDAGPGSDPAIGRKSVFPADPNLQCIVDVPRVTADRVHHRYEPMPFPVTVTVQNLSGPAADSVKARIVVPPELKLAGADAPHTFRKRVLPSTLLPGMTGSVQWLLEHPNTNDERTYVVIVWVTADNADSTRCEATVTIPAMDGPVLAPRCSVPDSLSYDSVSDNYAPNPFTAKLTCTNNGNVEARNVRATILIPPECELDPPSQPRTRTLIPSTIPPWKIGDPIPEVSWTVQWAKRYRYDVRVPIRFAVTAEDTSGSPLDTMFTECELKVRGLQPVFACELEMPDSLVLDAAGTGVEPNPFTVRFTLRNTGLHAGKVSRIQLELPTQQGFGLNSASSNPAAFDLDLVIDHGDQSTWEWIIDVSNRTVPRALTIRVTAWDDEGNPIICEKTIPVAAVERKMEAELLVEPDTLHCIADSPYVSPTHCTVTAILRNTSNININNLRAELSWNDLSGNNLIEFDPAWSDNSNPRLRPVLFRGQQYSVTWGMRLRKINTDQFWKQVSFTLRVDADNIPPVFGSAELRIGPNPRPFSLSVLGPVSFCEGDSVILDAGMGWASHAWNTGDSTRFLTVHNSGSYFATVTLPDGNGCPSRSDTVRVTVYSRPAKPSITQNGNLLIADSAASWQWYLDGTEIPGALMRSCTALQDGYYQVRVSNTFGCTHLSDSLFVTVTDAAGPHVPEVVSCTVYPNPSDGVFNLHLTGLHSMVVDITVRDLLGRERVRRTVNATGEELYHRIDLSGERPGVYFIRTEFFGEHRTVMVFVRP
mgnify:CR=1 FL=1